MAKTRLTKLAEEFEINIDEALNIAQEKLSEEMITGKGKATWINEEGVTILQDALIIPEIVPKHIKVKILHECPNRCYNWGYSKELSKIKKGSKDFEKNLSRGIWYNKASCCLLYTSPSPRDS